ncbi:MAG: SDR family NAD(P)-dependent oxidoreductase [Candidatus Velthaea sp.]
MALDRRIGFLLWLAKVTSNTFYPEVSVRAMRAGAAQINRRFGLRDPGGIEARDLAIPAGDGAHIGARLYRRSDARNQTLPVLLYFHGGGMVIGDIDSYDGLMRYIAREARIAVVAVNYRLGPEHPFPRGHEDAFDAYAWLAQHAAQFELDPARIAVGGDSAGGGLSATIASYAHGRGLPRPAYALLIYPSVDGPGRFPSRARFAENLPLTPASVEWFMKHATRTLADRADPLYVPLDAPDPQDHPPAYILAAQYDPLVDEGHAYFTRLRDAGVRAAYDLRPTLPHAFINLARVVPEAQRALDAGIAATAVALGARPARVAAITGAGAGIGRALAIELAGRGYTLALADRDETGLAQTVRAVRDRSAVSKHVVEVAQRAAVEAFAADVLRTHGRVDVVINNAGVSSAGTVVELTVDEIDWLMNVNFWGTVYGVKAFLPALLQSPGSTIVNLSSVLGLVAAAGQAPYSASKFAVRGFSEALREELRGKVHVLTVYPGGIKTNIARSARIAAAADQDAYRRGIAAFERNVLTRSPEQAARAIARGIERRSDIVLVGAYARRIDVLARLFGPRAARLIPR